MSAEDVLAEIASLRPVCLHGDGAAKTCPYCIARKAAGGARFYLTARYDVTDLPTEERGELALEVQAQAEHSDGHRSCEVEIEWDEVEEER